MACACSSGKKKAATTYVVVLPDGRKKSYLSEVAALAEVKRVSGAYLEPKR